MNFLKYIILTILIVFLSSSASSTSFPPRPLPEGAPVTIDGYSSRTLFNIYKTEISRRLKEQPFELLNRIDLETLSYRSPNNFGEDEHGTKFEFRLTGPTTDKSFGQAFYSCNKNKKCDWILKIVTVPKVDSYIWAYDNFDAKTAAAYMQRLEEAGVHVHNVGKGVSATLGLKTPDKKIVSKAKRQLYLGSECPAFMDVLGANHFGQDRVKHLLKITPSKTESNSPSLIASAKFEFGIAPEDASFEDHWVRHPIKLSLSGDWGASLGNSLIEAISSCPNRAD